MKTLGTLFLSALIERGTVHEFLRYGPLKHLFKNTERPLFTVFESHVRRHGTFPRRTTVARETGERLPKAPEVPGYYLEKLRQRYIDLSLRKAVDRAAAIQAEDPQHPEKALDALLSSLQRTQMRTAGLDAIDFRKAEEVIVPAYLQRATHGASQGILTRWPTFDRFSAGTEQGDLFSLCGRPSLGKTWMMLYLALQAWEQRWPVLFVSMEIKALRIIQRLSALYTGVPMRQILQATIPRGQVGGDRWAEYRAKLKEASKEEVPFFVVDANLTSTVEDIAVMARQFRSSVVFVDGAYLVGHPDKRLARHQRVAENCDLIKRLIAGPIGPVFASWQLSREATKLKKGERPGLEHIASSDAIGTHSSIVIGLFEEESIETLVRRRLDVLKGREGETGEFHIKWDFNRMDFSEVAPDYGELAWI